MGYYDIDPHKEYIMRHISLLVQEYNDICHKIEQVEELIKYTDNSKLIKDQLYHMKKYRDILKERLNCTNDEPTNIYLICTNGVFYKLESNGIDLNTENHNNDLRPKSINRILEYYIIKWENMLWSTDNSYVNDIMNTLKYIKKLRNDEYWAIFKNPERDRFDLYDSNITINA